MIIENFGTWATGPRWSHHPEIVIRCDANDAIIRQARNLFPHIRGLIIGMIDRDQEFFFGNIQFLGHQFPCKWDRLGFEIITKAKIPKHFEKCMVTCRITNVIQIVMFATRTHTFLRGGCAFVIARFNTREQVLKLNHTRIGKHQCRIVARHQGT